MAARRCHTAFDTMHPAVPALYVATTLGLTMCSMQPVLVGLSLLGGFVYGACMRGLRAAAGSLRWQLPVVAVVALVNPLFVPMGSTVLFELFGRPLFMESLVYGVVMAGLFVASVQWFAAASHMLPYDKVMGLLGNVMPVVTLMISMTMRLVPRLVRQGHTIASVQDVVQGCEGCRSEGDKAVPSASSAVAPRGLGPEQRGLKPSRRRALGLRAHAARAASRLRQSSVLMGWSMEDSLETANAMRARGWGSCRRRTTYVLYRFGARDFAVLVLLGACGAVCAWAAWSLTVGYGFYPRLTALEPSWRYVPYAAWMLIPAVLHVYERRRFA